MANAELSKLEADAKAWEATVEAWFKKHIEGTAIEADSALFAIAHNAKEELKKLFPSSPSAPVTTPAQAPAETPAPAAE